MIKLGLLLIVDDDPLVLEALNQTFVDDYDILTAATGIEAIEITRATHGIDAIILDIKMAKLDGLETASKLKQINDSIPIIFHTGYPGDYSEQEIEEEYTPFDYIGKNERPARLIRAVKNAVTFHQLQSSDIRLEKLAREEFNLVGRSKMMLDVYQKIEKISQTDNKVMILGPTGTGKDLVARAIHKRSSRADKPMAFFNCNHKSPDIVESELFGHLKGSFTGAISDREGIFEFANKGTVFLDEIGDLDIRTQAKILRVLESGEMNKIGSAQTIKVDVRLICATYHDLEVMVEKGLFREDLFFRLKGITIRMPYLKQRREDIPLLIDYFVENYCRKTGQTLKIFEPDARDIFIEYDWPGNVRQLLDTVQSLIDLSPSYYITKAELQNYLSIQSKDKRDDSFSEQVKEFKKILILKTLDKNKYNVSASARELSVDPANLRKIINSLNINY